MFNPVVPVPAAAARGSVSVYKAAMDLLLEQGNTEMSIGKIAALAGVNESSLYRRWKTKEILIAEVLLARVEEEVIIPNTGSLCSDLLLLLNGIIAFLGSPAVSAVVHISASLANEPELISARDIFWRTRFARIGKIFDRAAKRGEISSAFDRQLAVEMLIGPLYVRMFLTGEPQNDRLSEEIVDLLLNGLMQSDGSQLNKKNGN